MPIREKHYVKLNSALYDGIVPVKRFELRSIRADEYQKGRAEKTHLARCRNGLTRAKAIGTERVALKAHVH